LGEPGRAAVVLLDDCQWADEPTVKLLAAWQRRRDPAGRHTLVVAAFRAEDVSPNHPLRELQPVAHLQLGPLAGDEVALLAESMAGTLPGAALELVAQLADGNPFMAGAVLRGLVETDTLIGNVTGLELDAR